MDGGRRCDCRGDGGSHWHSADRFGNDVGGQGTMGDSATNNKTLR